LQPLSGCLPEVWEHPCFFSTLAIQLAKTSSIVERYIYEAIAKDDNIAQQSLSSQWKHLILEPLSRVQTGQLQYPNLVIVMDVLDECESQDDIQLILISF
jgi:hypothetical protein